MLFNYYVKQGAGQENMSLFQKEEKTHIADYGRKVSDRS